jgi:hypothetical protein
MELESKVGSKFFGERKSFKNFLGEEKEDVSQLSWNELRNLASEKEIKGYTKMKRDELERAINGH